ncbi:spore germination B3 GerAC family protein [Alkaliphilus metalliredigens QYMF]|uniref:Spore germination B3 GerAC family protein n=1 Tax=Alkaliphilus metalliredigens (strain QYMF) TaxID=293826 RepID=A6TT23_ALKMQ|nr:Ger(x)C family spore germination protein [Alkaliphilus metalliredigens]ABR49341.1 spore germination B3 GerAC family protein [Alkaliphilus metalliredigens QYMF]
MKKSSLILILLLSTLLTTSCWSRREIDELGFVMGLGISKTEAGLYSVVVQVANPDALVADVTDSRHLYTIIKSEGLTFFDALRNLSMVAGRRLYIAHITTLIIHDSIAIEGLEDVIGFLVQDMETRLETKILISKIPPEDILDTQNHLGVIPAVVLSTIADNYGANSKIYISDLHETVEAVNNPSTNYVTTLVEILPPPSKKELPQLKLTQIAIFEDDKLRGYLDYEEGQGFNLITNNFKNALIVFESAATGDNIVIEVLESTTKITPSYENEKVNFHIELKLTGNVAERVPIKGRAHDLDIYHVQDELCRVLENKLNRSISTAQEKYEVDYFNLSKDFHRKYPKEFKEIKDDWNEVFSHADITVKVESNVIHSALNLNRGKI